MPGLALIIIVAVSLLAWHYRAGRDRAARKLAELERLYGQAKREQRAEIARSMCCRSISAERRQRMGI